MRGDYGEVKFKKNGPVYFVKSSLTINETVTTGKLIKICQAPSWFIANDYWLSTRNSNGTITGIWTINNGNVQVFMQNTSDKSLIIEGVMMGW